MFTTSVSLIDQLRQDSSRAAWERFVDIYSPLLFSWAHRLGLSEHDVADLVQEVYAILVEQLPHFTYDPQGSFRAWLKTVLLNAWRKHRVRRAALCSLEGTWNDIPDTDPRLEIEEGEYRRYLVAQALKLMQAEFEETTWKACWEFVVQERPAADVAAELHLSINAVYLAKSRVLRRLRAELQGLLE